MVTFEREISASLTDKAAGVWAAQSPLFCAEGKSEVNYTFNPHMLHGAHTTIYLHVSVI